MKEDKQFIVLIVILICVLSLILLKNHFSVSNEVSLDIKNIPLKIDKWQGVEQEVEQDIFDILETDNVIVRTYKKNDKEIVYLAIVYYDQYKTGFHKPESCFVGQGSQILDKGTVDLKLADDLLLNVNKIIFGITQPNKVMFYFFKTGDYIGGDFKKFRTKEIINRVKMKSAGVAMIQISAPVQNNNIDQSLSSIKDFTKDVLPVLSKELL